MRSLYQIIFLWTLLHLSISVKGKKNICRPGYYLEPSGIKCLACPPGTYQSKYGAFGCIPCPKGSVNPDKGAKSCTKCDVGEKSNSDRTACSCAKGYEYNYRSKKCKICPAGTKNIYSSDYSYCEDCESGTYQPAEGAMECLDCPDGTSSSNKAKKCITCRDDEVVIKGKCGKCHPGRYFDDYQGDCEKCYPGTFQPNKTAGQGCFSCPPGSYSGYGYSACVKCKNREALMKNGECMSCNAGEYYSPYDLKCYKCFNNEFTPRRDVFPSCFNCGFSSFSFKGAKKCVRCKYGLTLLKSGKCGKCPPGTYLDSYKRRICAKCEANSYSYGGIAEYCESCPTNTYSLPGSSSCTTCPKDQALIVSLKKCGVCPPGKFYQTYDGTCTRCYFGEYKSEPGNDYCETCPKGFKSNKKRTACVEKRTWRTAKAETVRFSNVEMSASSNSML